MENDNSIKLFESKKICNYWDKNRREAETDKAKGLRKNAKAAKKGGAVDKNARKKSESKTGKSVVTDENSPPPTKEKRKLRNDHFPIGDSLTLSQRISNQVRPNSPTLSYFVT